MKNTTKTCFLSLLVLSLLIGACKSPYTEEVQNGKTTLTINLPTSLQSTLGEGESRVVLPAGLTHIIELSSETDYQRYTIPAGQTSFSVKLDYGMWTIAVTAMLAGEVYATGTATKDLQPGGDNKVNVAMTIVWDVSVSPSVINIMIGSTQQFNALVNGLSGQSFTWSLEGSNLSNIDTSGFVTVDPADLGLTFTVRATSAADPTRSGTATVLASNYPLLAGTLSVTGDGDWENATLNASYTAGGGENGTETFKWKRNGIEIPGAVGATYIVGDLDRGKSITASVQYSLNTGFVESSTYSIQNLTGIYTQAQLAAIRTNAASLAKNYILTVTTLALTGNWTPIGSDTAPFTGSFDGQNNTISGLTINTTADYQGLFGYVDGGTVKNLGLTGVNISGGLYTGAVVGYNSGGTIDYCSVAGSVKGNVIDTNSWVGGLVGRNIDNGTIQNCYTTCSVESSGLLLGGLAGQNVGSTIKNCYTTGNVIGTGVGTSGTVPGVTGAGGLLGANNENGIITNCYSTSNVTGYGHGVGGLLGTINNSTIENCFAIGNLIGYGGNVAGISGDVSYSGTIKNCVALNGTLTRAGSTEITYGRIVGQGDLINLSNNYANSGMTTNSGVAFVDSATGKDGTGVSAGTSVGQYNDISFWNTASPSGPGWAVNATKAAASETSPWYWGTNDLPRLWFE